MQGNVKAPPASLEVRKISREARLDKGNNCPCGTEENSTASSPDGKAKQPQATLPAGPMTNCSRDGLEIGALGQPWQESSSDPTNPTDQRQKQLQLSWATAADTPIESQGQQAAKVVVVHAPPSSDPKQTDNVRLTSDSLAEDRPTPSLNQLQSSQPFESNPNSQRTPLPHRSLDRSSQKRSSIDIDSSDKPAAAMAYRRNNVSQFQANLNLINPVYGAAEPAEDAFDQSNLDLFANSDFFDWEMDQSIHTAIGPETDRDIEKKLESSSSADVFGGDTSLEDYMTSIDFSQLSSLIMPDFPHSQPPQTSHIPSVASSSQPPQIQRPRNLAILPQPSHASPILGHSISPSYASPISPANLLSNQNPLKRKSVALDSGSSPRSLEEASRLAADEDKRRRNTAASARFRVKKKQREQALEQHSKDLETKVQELTGKVTTLENENKWLKDLLMEKHGSNEDFIRLIKSAPFPLSSLAKAEASDDDEEE
ncbi:hypothetical protein Dda_8048 [Drechslerella dactyloides]|uniref:BZIP domain-containing protein n=1 Tax=Drechslerella dactyloides TaxID=74499 RepID=A0AAD6IRN8_DREDA|nr:hypothetical protein Dda_8048 [Drechslerella dactyloides]